MRERIALAKATTILFWIPRKIPELPVFTTNVEFRYWLHSGKVIYGRPKNAPKTKYLDWLDEIDYNKKTFNNLDELLKEAIKITEIEYKEI